jgi:hypothetical protein
VRTGILTSVLEGTANNGTAWALSTANPITVDTTALTFTQIILSSSVSAGDGLQKVGNTLSVKRDATTSDPNVALAINVSANGVAVKIDGSTVKDDGTGKLKAANPTSGDKARASAVTSGNYQTTGLAITKTPAGDKYVQIFVNGVKVVLGDGVRTKDCYFSADGGTNARAISAIVATDVLYWNGVPAGYDLDGDDIIDMDYVTAA